MLISKCTLNDSFLVSVHLEHDVVAFVQLVLIMPEGNGEVELLIESFYIAFTVVIKCKHQRPFAVGIGPQIGFDEGKVMLFVLDQHL